MKIWLINNYNTLPEHGQFTRNYYFGKILKNMGHEPVVFVGSHPHNTNLQLIDGDDKYRIYQEEPFPWVLVKTRNYEGSKISRVISMFEFYQNMKEAAKYFKKPDAIVGSSAHPLAALLAIQFAKKFGCKGIVEIRDLWPESILAYRILGANNPIVLLMRRFEKWLYVHADAVVFTMAGAYDYIKEQNWQKEIPQSKVHYINNGIDLEQFDYNKELFTVQDKDLQNENIFKVVYTGSIRHVNNLGKLLDVAKLVKNPNVKFLIWGDGDEVPQLQERVENEKITNVMFKGRVQKKYVPYIVCKSNLNVVHGISSVLSRYGTSNNKIFDYMAAGKPILHDFFIKYNPVIDYNAGVEVQSGKPEDIAAMIDKLATSSPDVLAVYGKNAREAAKEFDFKVLTEKLISIIDSL